MTKRFEKNEEDLESSGNIGVKRAIWSANVEKDSDQFSRVDLGGSSFSMARTA